MKITTIGYEGMGVGEFFGCLINNQIEILVDIRELPLSRKAGFSKTPLSGEARSWGIEYVHLPALGCPREIRHEYRRDQNWPRYTIRFLEYLATQSTAVKSLAQLAAQKNCCLVCFEADPRFCHRYFVAEQLKSTLGSQAQITHLVLPAKAKIAGLAVPVGRSTQRSTIAFETCALCPSET